MQAPSRTPATGHAYFYITSCVNSISDLNDSLKLSGVFECVLDNLVAGRKDILFALCQLFLLSREIDATLLSDPTTRVCELNDSAFRVKEKEVLCVRDRKGGVSALAA